jgi:aconitate hydratase
MPHNLFNTLKTFDAGKIYSLPELEKQGIGPVSRLPVSIRIVLESVLRNYDGKKIKEEDIHNLANWKATGERSEEIPFVVARILLQDFTGVPLLVDLAAMRSAVDRLGKDARMIEPLVPVDLVVDHSVQVDYAGSSDALRLNMEMEFKRNRARYEFLKWGTHAFHGFNVVPPGIGIVHQVNLEYLARGVLEKDGIYYPDTLVGTDSHTTMINGLGIVGWGVGGIEAEAGMLGQPVYFLTPDVVGVHMSGSLRDGVTATDLVLHITEMLRKAKVVGKFVEFHGEGARTLAVTDRATIGNMSPEYGATIGYFPFDNESCKYLLATGRTEEQVNTVRSYFQAQGLFGIPRKGECDYSTVLELNLHDVQPAVAGPKRPQDRINLDHLKETFVALLRKPITENGYNKTGDLNIGYPVHLQEEEHKKISHPIEGGGLQITPPEGEQKNTSTWTELEMMNNRPTPDKVKEGPADQFVSGSGEIRNGSVLISAITSCTNTSNPSVMLGAGLLAKKAVERGLKVSPIVKTSLAPGSRVVTEYLQKTGLQKYLDELRFNLVGYGCTTCIGNSGPLHPKIEEVITKNDIVAVSVLSGNRNFEARVHQSIKANFLMSPPLVVAFALAGRVDIDLTHDPIGKGKDGKDVYLRDIWPTTEELKQLLLSATDAETYRKLYRSFADQNPMWNEIPSTVGAIYRWNPESTYIQEPPFFENFNVRPGKVSDIRNARPLAIFGDSVTTDHISPAGAIKKNSPAGKYLLGLGVKELEFNSYGSRRGNDRVMTRGTFANVRIKNLMVPGVEGGVTIYQPDGEQMSIFDAAMKYQSAGVPLLVIAGQEYGTGSSRDWAAKGARLLGVNAVVAQTFERIHRSNLVGMGVLPCQFKEGTSAQTLHLNGTETYDIEGLETGLKPRKEVTLVIHRADGQSERVPVTVRIDTPIEVDYYQHGGILPFVLRQLLNATVKAPNA